MQSQEKQNDTRYRMVYISRVDTFVVVVHEIGETE